MNLFNKTSKRIRSHGHHHYTSPKMHDIDGLPCTQKYLVFITLITKQTKLCYLTLTLVHPLYQSSVKTPVSEPTLPLYRLVAIIVDGHWFPTTFNNLS